ncbi:hypothetical protein [Micromonospora sp. NPDC049102]|uniref:hypothetical protein n=1 Tax=Micromonospora sp. NPDC049102 TaxID=3364265 RepID=UPI00371E747A
MAEGASIVDLTQTWDDAKTLNGDTANFTSPTDAAPKAPAIEGDGKGGYKNDKGEATNDKGVRIDGQGNPLDPPAPAGQRFLVQLDHIHRANDAILHEAKNQIAQFEAFRDEVTRDEAWMFVTDDPHKLIPYYHPAKNDSKHSEYGNIVNRPAGTYADVVDRNPQNTADTIQAQHKLLQACGSSIHLIGTFSGLLNDAGQMYAGADRASWAQEPE